MQKPCRQGAGLSAGEVGGSDRSLSEPCNTSHPLELNAVIFAKVCTAGNRWNKLERAKRRDFSLAPNSHDVGNELRLQLSNQPARVLAAFTMRKLLRDPPK